VTGGPDVGGLHVLADDDPRFAIGPVEQARAACAGGASVVQLRAKHAGDRQILEWGAAVRQLTRAAGVCFFVNDRFDLALLLEADGVHLGQGDLRPGDLPERARGRLRVGRSTHDREQARQAAHEGVAYVAFGPVFPTGSKDTGYTARGLDALASVVREVAPTPVVAIGGIDAAGAARAVAAGAAGIAVISAVAAAPDPEAATRALAEAIAARGPNAQSRRIGNE